MVHFISFKEDLKKRNYENNTRSDISKNNITVARSLRNR